MGEGTNKPIHHGLNAKIQKIKLKIKNMDEVSRLAL
jgi:hypothetical protein